MTKNWQYMATSLCIRYVCIMRVQTCTHQEATLLCMPQTLEFTTIHQKDKLEPYTILIQNIKKEKLMKKIL